MKEDETISQYLKIWQCVKIIWKKIKQKKRLCVAGGGAIIWNKLDTEALLIKDHLSEIKECAQGARKPGCGSRVGEDGMGAVAWVGHVCWEAMLRALAFALS